MTLYAKIDVNFPSDPRVISAGQYAELLYLRAILHSRAQLTDGFIDERVLNRIAIGIRGTHKTHAARLVAVGLWETAPGGWQIPERVWRKWNPTSDEVKAKRDAEAQRKADYRARKVIHKPVPPGQAGDNGNVPTGHQNVSQHVTEPEPEPEPEHDVTNDVAAAETVTRRRWQQQQQQRIPRIGINYRTGNDLP